MHCCIVQKAIRNTALALLLLAMGASLSSVVLMAEETLLMLEDSHAAPHFRNDGDGDPFTSAALKRTDQMHYGLTCSGILLALLSFVPAFAATSACGLWSHRRSRLRCCLALQEQAMWEARHALDMQQSPAPSLTATRGIGTVKPSPSPSPSFGKSTPAWDASTTAASRPQKNRAEAAVSGSMADAFQLGSGIGLKASKKAEVVPPGEERTAKRKTSPAISIEDLTAPDTQPTETYRVVESFSVIRAIPNPLFGFNAVEGEEGIRAKLGIDDIFKMKFPAPPEFEEESSHFDTEEM